MKSVTLGQDNCVPTLGLGTWNMGDTPARRQEEIATLRMALDEGIRLIDTAEMYGEGRAESLVGEAIAGRRHEAFLVSKVYPHNASRTGTIAACERSLKRMACDYLDLYLLHWRGNIALEETLGALVKLRQAGKIRAFGVSNFDLNDLQAWHALAHGEETATNQVLYNLGRRGIEWDLLPWQQAQGLPLMAYSPLEQARLLDQAALQNIARTHGVTPAHAALGWLLAQDSLITIPKTGNRNHLRELLHAATHPLSPAFCTELEGLFPKPAHPVPLAML
jgi:diketogulonate reductase-like aldo/keto reductase